MAKKALAEKSAPETAEDAPNLMLVPPAEAPASEAPIAPPARENSELLPSTESAAQTITSCSENEVKNYCATVDYIQRQVAVLLADEWEKVCRSAKKNGEDSEKPSKVTLAVKIVVNHSNIVFMDTQVELGFVADKVKRSVSAQEDLRQIQFALKA